MSYYKTLKYFFGLTFLLCLVLLSLQASATKNKTDPQVILTPNTPSKTETKNKTNFADTNSNIPLIAADDISIEDLDKSFSDFAIDELLQKQAAGERNPFAPGVIEEQADPSSLTIQGIVVSSTKAFVLISEQIFTTGDRIGYYTISKIQPGKIILKQLEDKYVVRMSSYSKSIIQRQQGNFFISFQNASLKKALELLADTGNINIIMPETTSGKLTVTFYNTDIMDAMASILRVNKLEYAFENDILRVGPSDQFADGSDLKTLTIPLNFATAEQVEKLVSTLASSRGKVKSDQRTNSIIVKDRDSILETIQAFINTIDIQDPQVSIEAKVVAASQNFSRAVGIQWGFSTGPSNVIFQGNQSMPDISSSTSTSGTIVNFPATAPTSGFNILVGRLPGNTNLETQLGAAESTGEVFIISKPNVTTINNQPASIRSGLTMYIKVDGGTDEGPTAQAIDTGIELTVTPQITQNRLVKMTIEATQSEADFSRTVDGIPSIIDNTADTTVLVPDGETAVIGGLLKANSSVEKRGIPGISKIPVLGWLFKSSTKSKENNELMIFITPKILDSQHFMLTDKETTEAIN